MLRKRSIKILVIGGRSGEEWAGWKAYTSSRKGSFHVEWVSKLPAGLNRLEKGSIDRVYVDPELVVSGEPDPLAAVRAKSQKAHVSLLSTRASRFCPGLLGLTM